MAKLPHQLLAQSLERAKKQAHKGVIRASDLTRLDRERLESNGWLTRVIRGWYLLTQPSIVKGDTTQWYSSYWAFISIYLQSRFANNYCLSASSSLDVHLGSTVIPKQLLVIVKKGGSSVMQLPFNTSILIYEEPKTYPQRILQVNSINVMPLAMALHRISPKFYQQQPGDAEIALKLVDSIELSRELLSGTNMASAARIIGAYEFLNDNKCAEKLINDLTAAGYTIEPINPLIQKEPILSNQSRIRSPYAARIVVMWQSMREDVLSIFSQHPKMVTAPKKFFINLEKIYVNDAYNSLSIEGYEVSEELIARIANGKWDPNNSKDDKNQINAMAAKGYRQAFEKVKQSLEKIFHKDNAGRIIKADLHSWYSALFSPSIKAGLLKPEHLAGYRNNQVYIRGSKHTPLPKDALIDAMEAFFDCMINEPESVVNAVLGHFIFVFIHPYMDGNGRIARFLMNTLFSAGGFPWTIVRVANRAAYLNALESASVGKDIIPFCKFLAGEMKATLHANE